MTSWKVRRTPGRPLTLSIGKAEEVELSVPERYVLASQLLGYPVEDLPGYVPEGHTPLHCAARGRHLAHRWAPGNTLWCLGYDLDQT